MKTFLALTFALALSVVVAGLAGAASDVSSAKTFAAEARPQVFGTAERDRDEVLERANRQINEWGSKLQKFGEHAKAETKEAWEEAKEKLGTAWVEVQKQWQNLKAASAETWGNAKATFDWAWDNFQRAWDDATSET